MARERWLPEHIPGSKREWQKKKRKEFKAVIKAFDIFRRGSAYTPTDPWKISKVLNEAAESLKVKNWK
jgi:hypothetical protein